MGAMVAMFTSFLLLPAPGPDAQAAPPPSIRQALANLDFGTGTASIQKQATTPQTPAPKRKRSMVRKVAGGVVGAVGGLFAGAYTGALFTNDCRCDDPGLEGAIIGAPIGAIIGAIIGARFF